MTLASVLLLAVAAGCYWKFRDFRQLLEQWSTFRDKMKQVPSVQ